MSKITNFIMTLANKAGTDGLVHLIICLIIVQVMSLFVPLWFAAFIGIWAGATKEAYDATIGTSGASWKDFICSCIGSLLGMVLVLPQI